MLDALLRRPRRVFYGWWVVAGGSVVNALSGGLTIYGFGVLQLPVGRELGLSRTTMSSVLSLAQIEGLPARPWVGWLIDRFGSQVMIIIGAILAGSGYILLAQTHSYAAFALVYVGVISLGNTFGFGMPVQAVVIRWFIRHRGLAMSILMAAFSAGGALIAPAFALLISAVGWRTAVVYVGLFIAAVLIPTSFLMRYSPEAKGLPPDGDRVGPLAVQRRPVAGTLEDFTPGEAIRTSAFWLLVAAMLLRGFVFVGFVSHFIPITVWLGADEKKAALFLGAWSILRIPATLIMGWIADRWSKTKLAAIGLTFGMIAQLVLLYGGLGWTFWLFAVLMPLAAGAVPLQTALVADFFGRRRFATIDGIMGMLYGLGPISAPLFAGVIYDHTESYRLVLLTFAAAFALASVLHAVMRPPRRLPAAY